MYRYECIYVCERDLSHTCVITIKEKAMNLKDNKESKVAWKDLEGRKGMK